MQQQINPHLLYNTLDSVLWGMQQHNYEDASQILHALSEFFKLSLSQGRMEIPLGDEIRMVESYLEEGRQNIGPDMVYGKSITDPCIGWEDTEHLIYKIAEEC